MSKWKFIHNGDGWWLRIENIDQLLEYQKFDNRTSDALSQYLNLKLHGGKHNNLSMALEMIGSKYELNPLNACIRLKIEFYKTCVDHIQNQGYVNINCVGGCNSIDYNIEQFEYRDTLSFPNYSIEDIVIKTFRPKDYRDGYKYHHYAYLGNLQLKDGEKVKWNTEHEAREFAKKYIQGV